MYNFENLGLNFVDEVDLEASNWEFYILAVWKNNDGYFLGTDSGCSCPSPFENYGSLEDFTGPLTAAEAIEEATSLWQDAGSYGPDDFNELISSIV